MRTINKVVVHCSATPPDMNIGMREIDRWHRERGWMGIGYHYVIRRNGVTEIGRLEHKVGAHVKGHNRDSIGICLIGGTAEDSTNCDFNFTEKQKVVLRQLIESLEIRYPDVEIFGHKDLDPRKGCPCFDVKEFLKD